MMNLIKKNEEIKRLKQLIATQKDSIKKSIELIDYFADLYIELQDENKKLKERINNMYWHNMKCPTHDPSEIIFPNTDERGLGEGDTPNDLSPLDL